MAGAAAATPAALASLPHPVPVDAQTTHPRMKITPSATPPPPPSNAPTSAPVTTGLAIEGM
jgi:hypothetical protein